MEMIITKRAKDLTKGIFKKGSVVDVDTEDMVVYHGGLEWKVSKISDTEYSLLDGETVFTVL